MKDYESLDDEFERDLDSPAISGDDFPSMLIKLISRINFRNGLFIFIVGLIVFSDVFVQKVLKYYPNTTTSFGTTTTWGTIIQLILLVCAYLVVDLLIQGGF